MERDSSQGAHSNDDDYLEHQSANRTRSHANTSSLTASVGQAFVAAGEKRFVRKGNSCLTRLMTDRAGLRGFLAVILMLGGLVGFRATEAKALVCDDAISWYQVRSTDSTNQYGVQAQGILVVNPASDCELMRSVYVQKNGVNWVEVGWYKDGAYASLDQCTDTNTPRILVYALVDNTAKCKPGTSNLSPGNTYSFRVENPDHDNDFLYYFGVGPDPDTYLGLFQHRHDERPAPYQ